MMGFYLKKSLKVGLFRFNFSNSGVGVSAGIKGLRIGTGPRGNYIHAGRGGFYYRASLPSGNTRITNGNQEPEQSNCGYIEPVQLQEIESGNVLEMIDSSGTSLLQEINEKHQKAKFLPWVITISIITLFIFNGNIIIALLLIVACIFAQYQDDLRKSVILFYDFEPEIEVTYQKLHDCFNSLKSCAKTWHIEAKGDTNDWKRNSGASSLVNRNRITLSIGQPPFMKTNIKVPVIPVGRQTLYFFPERILVFDKGFVGAVSYDDLIIESDQRRFIEEDGVPADSIIVDKTWKYVNKNGGPDRRFNNNNEIPITLYEQAHFKSPSGLNELIQLSKLDVIDPMRQAISNLSKVAKERIPC